MASTYSADSGMFKYWFGKFDFILDILKRLGNGVEDEVTLSYWMSSQTAVVIFA